MFLSNWKWNLVALKVFQKKCKFQCSKPLLMPWQVLAGFGVKHFINFIIFNYSRELQEASNRNVNLKAKIQNDFERLTSIQKEREEKEKYHELCQKIFK